jgi:hypothetical protein
MVAFVRAKLAPAQEQDYQAVIARAGADETDATAIEYGLVAAGVPPGAPTPYSDLRQGNFNAPSSSR